MIDSGSLGSYRIAMQAERTYPLGFLSCFPTVVGAGRVRRGALENSYLPGGPALSWHY